MTIFNQSKLLHLAAKIVALIFALNSVLRWYVGMFPTKDPYLPTAEPLIIAPPLSMEWMVGIWAFQLGQLMFSLAVIYLGWRAFVMILETHEAIGELKRQQVR
ncbi:hypothetical protein [Maritalea sp.]|uniref:hypothetical protein n=1 Tax=Maritalea sp. TaxID=2003361 RepID=UPI003EF93EE9